jgi:hypothetical protein
MFSGPTEQHFSLEGHFYVIRFARLVRCLYLVLAAQESSLVKSGLRRTQSVNLGVIGNMPTISVQVYHCNEADLSQHKVYETLKEKVNSTGLVRFSSMNVYIQWRLMPLFIGLFDEFFSIT